MIDFDIQRSRTWWLLSFSIIFFSNFTCVLEKKKEESVMCFFLVFKHFMKGVSAELHGWFLSLNLSLRTPSGYV